VTEEELNVAGVTVWARIWAEGVIGYCLIEGTVTTNLELLQSTVMPEVGRRHDQGSMVWQQTMELQVILLTVLAHLG
jgi:hypothetical protein